MFNPNTYIAAIAALVNERLPAADNQAFVYRISSIIASTTVCGASCGGL